MLRRSPCSSVPTVELMTASLMAPPLWFGRTASGAAFRAARTLGRRRWRWQVALPACILPASTAMEALQRGLRPPSATRACPGPGAKARRCTSACLRGASPRLRRISRRRQARWWKPAGGSTRRLRRNAHPPRQDLHHRERGSQPLHRALGSLRAAAASSPDARARSRATADSPRQPRSPPAIADRCAGRWRRVSLDRLSRSGAGRTLTSPEKVRPAGARAATLGPSTPELRPLARAARIEVSSFARW